MFGKTYMGKINRIVDMVYILYKYMFWAGLAFARREKAFSGCLGRRESECLY